MEMSDITSEILVRFFEGRTTSEENNAIADWIESDPDNQEMFNSELKYHLMLLEASSVPAEGQSVPKPIRVRHRISLTTSIAAALFAGAFIMWSLVVKPLAEESSQMMSFMTEAGQRASVTLPDGTSVELNSGTILEYPAVFSGKERRVRIDGEAMFEVASDSRKPFFVETFAYDVKVLGTKFNIIAEEQTGDFSTALLEGRVSILDKTETAVAELRPDQIATLVDGRLHKVQSENLASQYRWTEGIVNCGGLSFTDVLTKFEKTFGVDIRIEKTNIPDKKIRYMKVYVSDGPAAALELLQNVVDFDYSYDQKTNTYLVR
ncbi:MAG: FecR domain-containing protein [Bacteroidales bacterium]|nr:FecR domain-containing protein [Bacteroidales bacterium]